MTSESTATSAVVERVSTMLVKAHREFQQIESAPDDVSTLTLEQVYAIQDRVAEEMGGIGGWKVSAPGLDVAPIAAPLFPSLIGSSPATLPASRFHALGVEAEFGFRFGRTLTRRSKPYTREEVVSAIAALEPTIEVVDSRLGDWAKDDAMWKLADNQINGYLVHGQALNRWHDIDFAAFPVELWIDGKLVVSGDQSRNPAGDLFRLMTWLVNHLVESRSGIQADAIVTTGSYTGLLWVQPGQEVVARYPGVGEVSVHFSVP